VGRPVVVQDLADGSYVVLVTSGYNSTIRRQGPAVDAQPDTGAVITSSRHHRGQRWAAESGLAHISGFVEPTAPRKYVYGGDLLGNVWKFDLVAGAGPPTPTKVAVLKDSAGNTPAGDGGARAAVAMGDKRIVLVGTGRLLDINDFGSTRTQTFYAIADGATLANARSAGARRPTHAAATPSRQRGRLGDHSAAGTWTCRPASRPTRGRPCLRRAIAFVTNVATAAATARPARTCTC
jgi:type IV pilus assembly protein PilY1